MQAQLIIYLIFSGVLGALVGSFLNVVIYRLPEGLSIVTPPSACPQCHHRLAWYDNVPVFGWLWLSGRCRYCRMQISKQYPIIEALCALLFFAMFWANYLAGTSGPLSFILDANYQPLDQVTLLEQTWPILVVQWVMIAALLASVMVDAKLFIIPLELPWLATLVCLIGLPLSIWYFPHTQSWVNRPAPDQMIPAISGPWLGAALGALAGLILANLLLKKGIIPHGFSPEEEIALQQSQAAQAIDQTHNASPQPQPTAQPPSGDRTDCHLRMTWRQIGIGSLFAVLPIVSAIGGYFYSGFGKSSQISRALVEARFVYAGICSAIGLALAMLLITLFSDPDAAPPSTAQATDEDEQLWVDCPNPRCMVLKELLFLLLPGLGALAGYFGISGQPFTDLAAHWHVLGGVIWGYLIGCAMIWGIRILGTLLFNKEAMGLGDVHLLGAIGALVGWDGAILVFFIAPFFGLVGAAVLALWGKLRQGESRMIPYGPYLAGAALLIILFRLPIFAWVSQYLFPAY